MKRFDLSDVRLRLPSPFLRLHPVGTQDLDVICCEIPLPTPPTPKPYDSMPKNQD